MEWFRPPILLTLLAAAAVYVASRTLAETLGGERAGGAWQRAMGHALPIGFVAIAAVMLGQPAVAVGVLVASSVMCLTLAMGVGMLSAPLAGAAEGRSAWSMLLPIAVLMLLAGLMGGVSLPVAGGLLLLGAAGAWVWSGGLIEVGRGKFSPRRVAQVVLSIVVAGLAAVALLVGLDGAIALASSRLLTPGLAAATAVAPILVLPIVGSASDRAVRTGTSGSSIAVSLATAAINLCLWLPIVAAIYFRVHGSALPLPVGVWRVDVVLLIVVALLLLPIAQTRWPPGKAEGVALVGTYVLYLVLIGAVGWRG